MMSVKGGVGSFGEAGRITALSKLGEKVIFFDFIENPQQNLQGDPSNYSGLRVGGVQLFLQALFRTGRVSRPERDLEFKVSLMYLRTAVYPAISRHQLSLGS